MGRLPAIPAMAARGLVPSWKDPRAAYVSYWGAWAFRGLATASRKKARAASSASAVAAPTAGEISSDLAGMVTIRLSGECATENEAEAEVGGDSADPGKAGTASDAAAAAALREGGLELPPPASAIATLIIFSTRCAPVRTNVRPKVLL